MGEVLVFEVAIERFFGFQDSGLVAAGVAVEASVGRATAASLLQAAGVANAGVVAGARASALLQAIGAALGSFRGIGVRKLSGSFSMAGTCTWYARGVTFKPRMPLADDCMVRAREGRGMLRPLEYRASMVLAASEDHLYDEQRRAIR
ncbi:hypothetical protein [Polaromonas sp.]|uniref:hypothetical protein n=1 Tax=Polaromonas sp. TaxID=1869339 RepID=UPI0032649C02